MFKSFGKELMSNVSDEHLAMFILEDVLDDFEENEFGVLPLARKIFARLGFLIHDELIDKDRAKDLENELDVIVGTLLVSSNAKIEVVVKRK